MKHNLRQLLDVFQIVEFPIFLFRFFGQCEDTSYYPPMEICWGLAGVSRRPLAPLLLCFKRKQISKFENVIYPYSITK